MRDIDEVEEELLNFGLDSEINLRRPFFCKVEKHSGEKRVLRFVLACEKEDISSKACCGKLAL